MMKISSVTLNSIADEIGLIKGDEIISINDKKPVDIIEYSFLIQEEDLKLHIKRGDEEGIFEIEKDLEDDLGISFESAVFDKIKPCCNKCIFCFVDGQPKGLRDSLYVKDDDWRLSYLQGTYITLTNFTQKDWDRIERLRPSPLYVSVHTTNPLLREKMLNNPRAGEIIENLKRLEKLNINFHAQVVLCPNYNDGKELERTVSDLKKFKNILSLAVVPVGISKHHKNQLKPVTKEIALHTIKTVEGFGMASDEFFTIANLDIPDKKYYGKFHQIEDGVGAVRLLLDDYKKTSKKLKKELKKKTKLTLATGKLACDIFSKFDFNVKGLEFELIEVKNKFFGDRISVAGLICGCDLLSTLKGHKIENLIIPSIMLREGTEEFLDGVKVEDIQKQTGAKIFIIKDCYSFREFVKIINSF